MPSPTRVRPLPLDVSAFIDAGLVSLSVELQPLRKDDDVAALLLALRQYPVGFPKRDEKITDALGGKYAANQLAALRTSLESSSPSLLELSSSLPQDGSTVYLIPPVTHCVACSSTKPLHEGEVQPDVRSSATGTCAARASGARPSSKHAHTTAHACVVCTGAR